MAELLRVPPTRARALVVSPERVIPSHERGGHKGAATTGNVRNGGFMLSKWKRSACHISFLNEKNHISFHI